jgi:rare lipoprotein A
MQSEAEYMRFKIQIGLLLIVLSSPAFAAQTVRATWYGHELAGNRTASGEGSIRTVSPRLTVHYHSAPASALVPKTGRKVAVRVNDRGPFTKGVSLDLSYGAAQAIGMRSTQSVTVETC